MYIKANHPKVNLHNNKNKQIKMTCDLFTKKKIHLCESYVSIEELPRELGLSQQLTLPKGPQRLTLAFTTLISFIVEMKSKPSQTFHGSPQAWELARQCLIV